MEQIAERFEIAHSSGSGIEVAHSLDPSLHSSVSRNPAFDLHRGALNSQNSRHHWLRLLKSAGNSRHNIPTDELEGWADTYFAFWTFLESAESTDTRHRKRRYERWRDVSNSLIKGYSSSSFESWTLPCLYMAGRWLRTLAIEADKEEREYGKVESDVTALESDDIAATLAKNYNLEDAARVINRMFTLCITDRAPMIDSRKWGLYYITNLLFKTYFKLNSISLCKNPWRALQASHIDMPPIEAFPKSHVCTFKYYVGLIFFLEEDYSTAEANLSDAYKLCHKSATRNMELILTYLIPCRLINQLELPRTIALAPYGQLQRLFQPLCSAIRRGNLSAFDAALAAGELELTRARVYLTLERGRDICLRNLFRKVFLLGGSAGGDEKPGGTDNVRRTRIPIDEFVAAVRVSAADQTGDIDRDEVECLLANAIYKGQMKAYIARDRGIVVVSKGVAFPGTNGSINHFWHTDTSLAATVAGDLCFPNKRHNMLHLTPSASRAGLSFSPTRNIIFTRHKGARLVRGRKKELEYIQLMKTLRDIRRIKLTINPCW